MYKYKKMLMTGFINWEIPLILEIGCISYKKKKSGSL